MSEQIIEIDEHGGVHVPSEELAALFAAVQDATERYREACQVYDDASRERTARVNALNVAQRAFDAALAKVRQQAPRDSDWQRAARDHDAVRVGAGPPAGPP